MQNDLILYDYFSFTSKHHSAATIIDLLGMDAFCFQTTRGARGYVEALRFCGVNVFFGSREEVWCEMSGEGCRAFETHGHGDWDVLLGEIRNDNDYNITRLDVAFDDRSGLLDLDLLFRETGFGNFIAKFDAWDIRKSNKGTTIKHGSESSKVIFRIYDKAKERRREDEGHWVRFEIQLRDEKAYYFIDKMALQSIGEVYSRVVNNYIRYVTPNNDSNKRRWHKAEYWKKFIETTERHSLYETPGMDYNLEKLEKYVYGQCGPSIAVLAQIDGSDKLFENCSARLAASKNPKYEALLKKYENVPQYT